MREFEGPYRKSGRTYHDDFLKDDSPSHKFIITILS